MTDTLTEATRYTAMGLRVVPVNGKRPPDKGWQNMRLDAADLPRYFANGAGVGVLCGEPSGGLVDVDKDCGEAVALARYFLPKTALRHGRPSRWWRLNLLSLQVRSGKVRSSRSSVSRMA